MLNSEVVHWILYKEIKNHGQWTSDPITQDFDLWLFSNPIEGAAVEEVLARK